MRLEFKHEIFGQRKRKRKGHIIRQSQKNNWMVKIDQSPKVYIYLGPN